MTAVKWRAAVASLALFVVACSGDSDGGNEGATGSASQASSPGITDETLRLGVVLLDLSTLEPLGMGLDNFEVETQQEAFEVFIDAINDDGGVGGRTVEPVYVVNDPLNADAARAGCLELTEDEDVFAVVGFVTDAAECIAVEHETPLLFHTSDLDSLYRSSSNRLVGPGASLERTAAGWAAVMEQTGDLAGRTLGIVAVDDGASEQLPADALQSTLEQLGHAVGYRAHLPGTADAAAIALEVPRMRDAGVDTVFLSTNFATAGQFVQVSEQQGFTPQYLTSEIGTLANDGLVQRMPASFDGALAVTSTVGGPVAARSGQRAQEAFSECLDRYNDATGSDLAWGVEHALGGVCSMMTIFEAAATAVEDDLSQVTFVDAVQQLGDIELPGRHGGSFAPGKTDYADVFSVLRWSIDCACYEAFGDPVAVG